MRQESVGISKKTTDPCHTVLRRPPRSPFSYPGVSYPGVSYPGVRHSPGELRLNGLWLPNKARTPARFCDAMVGPLW